VTSVLQRLNEKCLADIKALGPKPWFWRRKKRKAWSEASKKIVVQYLRDFAYVLAQIVQGVTPIDWVKQQWGQARVEDGEVN